MLDFVFHTSGLMIKKVNYENLTRQFCDMKTKKSKYRFQNQSTVLFELNLISLDFFTTF